MPSAEEVCEARANVKQWAIEALIKDGHPKRSAEMIVANMDYERQIEWAEKVHGLIYRGPYSAY